MIRDTELQEQIDSLREDVQTLRKQLASGVGVPDYRPFANGTALTISAGLPTWIAPSTYVGSVTAGAPLSSSGGLDPVITHNTSGVVAGTYTYAAITINATGHITSAASGTSPVITVAGTAPISVATSGTTRTVSHSISGVSANTYAYPSSITVNASGHITAMTAGSAGSTTWGSIGGTLSSQTDLQSALNGKIDTSYVGTSGFTIPLCANANTWGAVQTFAVDAGGGYGGQIVLRNTASGASAINKTLRISPVGTLEIINNAFSAIIFSMTDLGLFSASQVNCATASITGTATIGTLNLPGSTGQYVRGDGSRATFPSVGSGSVTSVATGVGLTGGPISTSGTVSLGTPSTLTASTSNSASGTTHTHAISGFMPTTGGAFSGGITGTTASFSGSITQSSDAKFKTDVRSLSNGLDVVRALLPRRYLSLITDSADVGFVAQELQKVLPELVVTDDNGDLAVAYHRITAPLVAAVQTLDHHLRITQCVVAALVVTLVVVLL